MRILLTVHQFFPEYFSGTEVLTFITAKELIRRGHDVIVFTGYPAQTLMTDAQRFDQYEIEGIQVYRVHHANVPMGEQKVISEMEYNHHLIAQYFLGLLTQVKPDIVHFFHFSRLSAALVDATQQQGIPAYYTPTDFWAVCPTSQLLLSNGAMCDGPLRQGGNCIKHIAMLTRWQHYSNVVDKLPAIAIDAVAVIAKAKIGIQFPFKSEIAALSDRKSFNITRLNALQGIVSPTRLMTDILTRNGVDPALITQSAYGINVDGFLNLPRPTQQGRGLVFGYMGTLAPHKGCHILIKAFLSLPPDGSTLAIYGNPNDFPAYFQELQAAAGGSLAVEFRGTFPNDQIAEVFGGIDALIVPSVWYENTPLVVYSALAAKCPVIASDFPGMSEVIRHDWNGLLFKPSDAESLAQCLARLQQNPALLDSLSHNCLPPKSISTYVDELLALYVAPRALPTAAPTRANFEPSYQVFSPYRPQVEVGQLSGWVLASSMAPRAIRLLDAQALIGQCSKFLPRPDVRDGLKRSGVSVKGVDFGFVMSLIQIAVQSTALLEIDDAHGITHSVSLAELAVGQSKRISEFLIIGIDQFTLATPTH